MAKDPKDTRIDVKVPKGEAPLNKMQQIDKRIAEQGSPEDKARSTTKDRENDTSQIKGKKFDTRVQDKFALRTRYRIPEKLKRTPKKKLKELAQHILDEIDRNEHARSAFMQRIAKYRESWRNLDNAGLNITIDGQHDEHIPLIFEKGKTMHARIYQAVFGIDPFFVLKPRKAVDAKLQKTKESILSYVFKTYMNKYEGMEEVGDTDILNFVYDGTAITKHGWCREVKKYVDVEETLVEPIELDENGEPAVEETEVEVERIEYDGPIMECRPIEAVRIIGPRVESIEDADMVADEQEYTKSKLIKLSRQGFFLSSAVDMVLSKVQPTNKDNRGGSDQLLRNQMQRIADMLRDDEGKDTYRVFETYLSYDIDDDGIDEDLVVWVEEQTKTILRITYLDRVSLNGKRPFVLKKFIPAEGTPYGIGFGEILYGINRLLDYIANQRLDAGTFQTFPWFFFTASSGLDAGDMVIGPGKGIPVDDPSQVVFPRVNGTTQYSFNEESLITKYAERASGISEFAQGQIGGQGATRTATGTASLVQELNTNLDIFIRRYQRGFKKNLGFVDKQVQELLPLGLEFTVIGNNQDLRQIKFKDRKAIAWDADFELVGNSINSNKAIERETASQILQTQLNPIVLQIGLVDAEKIYNGIKNLFQKLEIKDIDSFLVAPPETQMSPFTAKDEINMIVSGVKPPIQSADKHEEKLAFYQAFEDSDEFGFLEEESIPLYMEAKSAHEQFAQAITAQQGQAAQQGFQAPGAAQQAMMAAGSGNPSRAPAQQITDLVPEGAQ